MHHPGHTSQKQNIVEGGFLSRAIDFHTPPLQDYFALSDHSVSEALEICPLGKDHFLASVLQVDLCVSDDLCDIIGMEWGSKFFIKICKARTLCMLLWKHVIGLIGNHTNSHNLTGRSFWARIVGFISAFAVSPSSATTDHGFQSSVITLLEYLHLPSINDSSTF